MKKGTSISIRRRPDYWAAKYRANIGQYNFDEIRLTVVRDQNLAFEIFKKGDLDYHSVNISQQWVQELNTPAFQRGLLVKRKVFNNYPQGTQFRLTHFPGLFAMATQTPDESLRHNRAHGGGDQKWLHADIDETLGVYAEIVKEVKQ